MNKRRYERQTVAQGASLNLPGIAELPGEIRDFCEGGLLLKLAGGERALNALRSLALGEVDIYFNVEPGSRRFQVRGTIAHLSPHGVGVAFVEPSSATAAIHALNRQVRACAPDERKPASADIASLRTRCHQVLETLAQPLLAAFFADIRQPLIKAAEKAPSNAAQAVYFEAMTLLQERRADIEGRFIRQIEAAGVSGPNLPEYPEVKLPTTDSLSLVDKEAFDDWLGVAEEITRLENRHDDSLRTLAERLGTSFGGAITRKNHPYGPGVVLYAFRHSLGDLAIAIPAKRVIYAVFARTLAPHLGSFYQKLLEATQTLESVAPAKGLRRVPDAKSRAQAPGNAAEAVKEAVKEDSAGHPSPPAVAVASPDLRTPGPLDAASLLMTLTTQSHRPVAGPPARSEKQAAAPDPAAILAALQQVQHRKLSQGIEYLSPETLETELGQTLAASGQAAGALRDEHKQAINILEALLDNTLKEESLAPGVKRYVQTLQIPLLEAALSAPDLLHLETHPAREVLNLLDHFSLAANDQGEIEQHQLKQSLDTITARVAREAAHNPGVLLEAQAQLEKLAAPLLKTRALRIERVREASEARQRTEEAHRIVDSAIDARLGGKYVASIVPELLETGWRQLLILATLRQGQDSEEWLRITEVLDQLMLWLDREQPQPPRSVLDAHRLINYVDEQLVFVCSEQMRQNRIVEALVDLLLGSREGGERRIPEWVFVPARDAASEEIEDVEAETVQRFRVGDWLKFALQPGVWTPARLTWIGGRPARYVFVNQKGGKALEVDAHEFVRYLRESKAVEIESLDLPLMERTTNTLIQTMQDRLKYQANHDPTTGLVNRKEFVRWLERTLVHGEQTDLPATLGLLEIAQFRVINNLCGMEAGDRLLREVGELIGARLGIGVPQARMGDSVFGFLLGGVAQSEGLTQAENLLQAMAAFHFKWGEHSFAPGAHIGLAEFSPLSGSVQLLLKQADAACLTAREKGLNIIHCYAEDDTALKMQARQMDWAGRIDRLLAEERLCVRCQLIAPIFPGRDSHSHYEILLGIRNEEGDVVSPYDFVVAAERWKRISEIDRWQVSSVFDWIRRHRPRFDAMGGFSINLSGQSINSLDFLDFLQEELAGADWPLGKITFEVTETAAIGEFGQAEKFIRQIRRHGCKFSLDDFGSGSSSYGYLKNLRVDYLKIDGSFVKDLATSAIDYAMVKSMNEIGHSLGMKTIAEYVEDEAILEKLREIGVDYAQGYGIGKPALIDKLAVE